MTTAADAVVHKYDFTVFETGCGSVQKNEQLKSLLTTQENCKLILKNASKNNASCHFLVFRKESTAKPRLSHVEHIERGDETSVFRGDLVIKSRFTVRFFTFVPSHSRLVLNGDFVLLPSATQW
jgi:hypothetical protein